MVRLIPYHLVRKDIVGEHVKYLTKNKVYVKVVSVASLFERNQTIFYPYWDRLVCQTSSSAFLGLVCPDAEHCLTCNYKANKAKTKRERILTNIFSSFQKCGSVRYPVVPLFHFSVSSLRGLRGSRPCLRRKLVWELWENFHLQSEVEDLGLLPVPCVYDDFKAVCHVFLYNFLATKIVFALKMKKWWKIASPSQEKNK